MTPANLTCLKAYDIRGRVPEELNPEIAYRVGSLRGCNCLSLRGGDSRRSNLNPVPHQDQGDCFASLAMTRWG
ncbi:MAG: hypothetical protein COS57_06260 [Syntrophobacterales bacterium CG03_land_8_20_14_0_80_58_14]|nr:MAG: hypothetical protein COS57_06260 [Syntrophobacterales bacterium CG03_land_8_20_14_0_80_58_14]